MAQHVIDLMAQEGRWGGLNPMHAMRVLGRQCCDCGGPKHPTGLAGLEICLDAGTAA